MEYKKIFVTVGTTEFDSLLRRLSECELYDILKNHLGCKELTIQYGRGEKVEFKDFDDIKVQMFGLKDSILDDIKSADLVIIHNNSKDYQIINHKSSSDNKSRWCWNLH